MCVRILIAENRLDRAKSFQRCRRGKSIVCIIGSDDFQRLEPIGLPERDWGAALLDIAVIKLVEGHFGYFERIRTRKSATKS